MQNAIFLAQFWGWLLIILGVLFFFRGNKFLSKILGLADDKEFTLLSGYLALILGLTTVLLHNVWVDDLRVAITILGWVTLAKGVTRIALPELTHSLIGAIKGNIIILRIVLLAFVVLGVLLVRMS